MFVVFFIAYTPPSKYLVEGLQGRYFIPMTIFIVTAISGLLPNFRVNEKGQDNAKLILISLSAFCLVFSIWRYGLAIS
jgi:hypothetical protein